MYSSIVADVRGLQRGVPRQMPLDRQIPSLRVRHMQVGIDVGETHLRRRGTWLEYETAGGVDNRHVWIGPADRGCVRRVESRAGADLAEDGLVDPSMEHAEAAADGRLARVSGESEPPDDWTI